MGDGEQRDLLLHSHLNLPGTQSSPLKKENLTYRPSEKAEGRALGVTCGDTKETATSFII